MNLGIEQPRQITKTLSLRLYIDPGQYAGGEANRCAPSVGDTRVVATCPQCRASMRKWALDAMRPENRDVRDICLRAAIDFRDGPCFHTA